MRFTNWLKLPSKGRLRRKSVLRTAVQAGDGTRHESPSFTFVSVVTRLFRVLAHHTNQVGKIAALMIVLLSGSLHGERLYSYVDDSGATVLTNLGSDRAGRGASRSATSAESDDNYSALIRQYGTQYGVDTDLISAIIKVESGFDSRAVSTKDCKGLMQLHPDTAKRFGVSDVFDPAENIEGGVKYLTFLMDSFDRRLDLVLAAYNAGENAVRRYQGIPPYPETIHYVDKVKTAFGKDLEPLRPERRIQRVVRIVDESGAIVLTNAPVQEVETAQAALLTR